MKKASLPGGFFVGREHLSRNPEVVGLAETRTAFADEALCHPLALDQADKYDDNCDDEKDAYVSTQCV